MSLGEIHEEEAGKKVGGEDKDEEEKEEKEGESFCRPIIVIFCPSSKRWIRKKLTKILFL